MVHTKRIGFEDIKLLLALTLIMLVLMLSACGQKSSQNEISVSGDTLSAPLPSALLAVDETNLVVEVVVDGGASQTCANLLVDQGNETYSCNITLSGGPHTISLIFSIIDANYGTVQVATASGIDVDVVPGQIASADFSTVSLNYDLDDDFDGIRNLDELDEGSDPGASSYYVGGTVNGLSGSGAVIQLNGGNDLILSSDGSFQFIPAVANTSTYTVTVLTQPSNPNQICNVTNGSDTVSGANVTNVTVTCVSESSNTIGGMITGLVGSGLVLQNNGVDNLAISANGSFTFATGLADGSLYAVTVLNQPSAQTCIVSNGSGTIASANVTNISVNCDTKAPQTSPSVPGGLYNSPQNVVLTCVDDESGCSMTFFTTDNSEPDENSEKYTGPITISNTATLRFFSIDNSGNQETVKSVTYTIDQVAPAIVTTFNDPIIDVSTSLTLTFNETMQPQSLVFSGDLSDKASASWSQDVVSNDTLTISPKVEWPIGTGQRLIIDANDLAGNSLARLTLEFDVSVIHVSVDATNANDSNVGTRDQPLQTIIAAVNRANSTLSKSEIRVALGTYTTFDEGGTNIQVSDGMRLMGSYSADWLLRNPITYASIVNDTSTTTDNDFNNTNCVINISAGAGSETLVDGFTLTGGGVSDDSGNGASCGIEIEMNASPTIENNIISGGNANVSTGIIDRGLSPVIRNNTIRNNEPGAYSWVASGISSNGSSPTIIGNDINCGSVRYSCAGLSLTDVNAIIEQNSIVGGGGESSSGVSIGGTSTVLLRNNTIQGGGYNGYGVKISDGSTITLQNNTIFSQGSFSVTLYTGSPAIIENNIFFGDKCIWETSINADPITLFANNIYGCEQQIFYWDYDEQCTGNADGDNDAHTCTLAEMNQLTDMQVDGSNINVDLGFDTNTDADWHLNALSPASVKFGGRDLSIDFSTDKDGTLRTVPWSIGAYEQD